MCEQQSVDIAVLMSRLSSLINPPDMIRIALAWLHRLHTLQRGGIWTVGAFIFLSFSINRKSNEVHLWYFGLRVKG